MNDDMDFLAWSAVGQKCIEATLLTLLPSLDAAPQQLHEAMHYAVLQGGKRVRPLLAFAAGELTQANPATVAVAASAVEMVHAYSLVHDDLPCMDDDVLRRGKPTCHVQYDEPTALLVGDALQSLAFQVLAENKLHVDQSVQLKMVRLLAAASGSRGMAGGQAIDLESVGEVLNLEQLEFMHSHKTGAIIRAACLLGLYCGQTVTPATHASVNEFGRLIGLAFQVVDDVLDAEASADTLGRTAGKDLEQGKPTYVSAMGLDKSKTLALQLREEAMEILTEFGDRARRLRELADFIVLRKF